MLGKGRCTTVTHLISSPIDPTMCHIRQDHQGPLIRHSFDLLTPYFERATQPRLDKEQLILPIEPVEQWSNRRDMFNLPRTHVFHGLPTFAHSITQHGLLGNCKLRDRSERET